MYLESGGRGEEEHQAAMALESPAEHQMQLTSMAPDDNDDKDWEIESSFTGDWRCFLSQRDLRETKAASRSGTRFFCEQWSLQLKNRSYRDDEGDEEEAPEPGDKEDDELEADLGAAYVND